MSTIKSKQLEGVKADQLLSNNITAVVDPTASQDISQGYFPSSVWVNAAASPKKVFICSDNSLGSAVWNLVAPSSSAQTVTQVLHGFTVGQVLKHSGGSYALAQADTQANIGIWLVTKVIDANTFQIVQSGYVTGLSGGTADETWYLSDTTAGGLVNTAPTIAQPIIYWITASEGWVLGYPATTSGTPSGSVPVGSIMAIDIYHQSTPLVLPADVVECNGQVISDGASPYNGQRVRNLNGQTVLNVLVTAIDDINKLLTVSLNDVWAFSVGDTLSFTGASVPDAVVGSVNETTGEILISDSTGWTGTSFPATSYSLIGITDMSSVGQPRFLKGSGAYGSGVNQFQGHEHNVQLQIVSNIAPFGVGSNTISSFTTTTYQTVTNGVDGTPRTGTKTVPDSQNILYVIKIK